MAPRIEGSNAPGPIPAPPPRYVPGASLATVRGGMGTVGFGDSGPSVRELQRLLNATGARPPLAEDGLFGPKTLAALQSFQGSQGLAPSGRADALSLSALGSARPAPNDSSARTQGPAPRAPVYGAPAPEGSVPSHVLSQADEARRSTSRTGAAAPAAPTDAPAPLTPTVTPGAGRADAELQAIQARTMDSARRELAAGVHEDHSLGDNRSPRIDQYARDAGMPPGGQWCGYFTGFNYAEAARASGGRFRENIRFHSMQKARAYFEYRNYTNNSPAENRRLDELRAQQEGEGSTRRWMVLSGSGGERHARDNRRPYETFEPNNLPIRAGDTALFSRGHVGLVESYDAASGRLVTIEGNSIGEAVRRRTYDLNDPRDRAAFEGFGRPARGDFELP